MTSTPQQFRSRLVVTAKQFIGPEPCYPVQPYPCYCEPQDGFACPNCRGDKTREYGIRNPATNGWLSIKPGNWFTTFPNGAVEVLTTKELESRFEAGATPEAASLKAKIVQFYQTEGTLGEHLMNAGYNRAITDVLALLDATEMT